MGRTSPPRLPLLRHPPARTPLIPSSVPATLASFAAALITLRTKRTTSTLWMKVSSARTITEIVVAGVTTGSLNWEKMSGNGEIRRDLQRSVEIFFRNVKDLEFSWYQSLR